MSSTVQKNGITLAEAIANTALIEFEGDCTGLLIPVKVRADNRILVLPLISTTKADEGPNISANIKIGGLESTNNEGGQAGIPNSDLFDLISQYHLRDMPEVWAMIISAIRDVAQGLDTLHHKLHTVHNDIKPENILVDDDGKGYIIDYEYAQCHASQNGPLYGITHAGTAFYKSPEYTRAVQNIEDVEEKDLAKTYYLTEKQDIWSLGVALYVIMYREFPFCTEYYMNTGDTEWETAYTQMKNNEACRFSLRKMTARNPNLCYEVLEKTHSLLLEMLNPFPKDRVDAKYVQNKIASVLDSV